MRYNVEHTNSSDVRAIAECAGGDVISDVSPATESGTGIAVIQFPDDQLEYVETMLDDCESVVLYR